MVWNTLNGHGPKPGGKTDTVADIDRSRTDLSSDMLFGAEAIAAFIYGPGADRQRVYRMSKTRRGFPLFRLGGVVCARRSKVMEWIDREEQKSKHSITKDNSR